MNGWVRVGVGWVVCRWGGASQQSSGRLPPAHLGAGVFSPPSTLGMRGKGERGEGGEEGT